MFLPTTISDTAVEKAFMEFGEVHVVFPSTFKKDFNEIRNGKRHVRLTPFGSNFPMTSNFRETREYLRSCGPKKNFFLKTAKLFIF